MTRLLAPPLLGASTHLPLVAIRRLADGRLEVVHLAIPNTPDYSPAPRSLDLINDIL
jgi:hypothetical protein